MAVTGAGARRPTSKELRDMSQRACAERSSQVTVADKGEAVTARADHVRTVAPLARLVERLEG